MVQFLSVVTNLLESLYLCPSEMSSEILDSVSSLCPSLTSFALTKTWSEKLSHESLERYFPQSTTCALRSFTVSWSTLRLSALFKILSNAGNAYRAVSSLKVLHIRFVCDEEFDGHAARFESMLNSNQVLEQVYLSGWHWRDEAAQLENRWNGRLVSAEKTRGYRLGFLSVLAHDSIKCGSSLDLVELIFGFV